MAYIVFKSVMIRGFYLAAALWLLVFAIPAKGELSKLPVEEVKRIYVNSIEAEIMECDLGAVPHSGRVFFEIEIESPREGVELLHDFEVSCSCVKVDFFPDELRPGKTVKLQGVYTNKSASDRQQIDRQSVILMTDRRKISVKLLATCVPASLPIESEAICVDARSAQSQVEATRPLPEGSVITAVSLGPEW